LVFSEECNITLDEHADIGADELLRVVRAFDQGRAEDTWIKVENPQRHDVVIMDHVHGRTPVHCGIMRDKKRVLHVWRTTDSVIMPLTDPRLANNILGFYRHRELT
jgi:hypothetical protein